MINSKVDKAVHIVLGSVFVLSIVAYLVLEEGLEGYKEYKQKVKYKVA